MSYLVLTLKVLAKMSAIWGICATAFFLILAGVTVATGSKTWLKDLLLDREIHKKITLKSKKWLKSKIEY